MQISLYSACSDANFCKNILEKIPDEPRIPIANYLLDLVCEDDWKEKSIYFNGAEHIIKEIWEEIIQENWRTFNVRKTVPQKLNITPSVFYAYKNGRKKISIQTMYQLIKLWKDYCNKSEEELCKKWDSIFDKEMFLSTHSRYQKTTLPTYISPKLSYLLGWICGDGNLQKGKNHFLIKISEKSKDQLELILKPLFQEIFGVTPPIYLRYGKGYAIQIGSKPIFRFLKNVMDVKVGEIPQIIESFDLINKKYFLIGLFDAEGYANPKYLDSVITISQSSKQFLEKTMALFNEIKINFIGPHKHKTKLGIWYTIKIRRKMDILKFINEVGSCHIDKIERLQKLGCVIEKNWNS